MKLNKIIPGMALAALMFTGCYDEKMEWGTPDGHGDVNISDIPLNLAEQLANYDFIKAYAAKHTPNMLIGIGLGADTYIDDAAYRQVANDNFQMITTGNAMKHASVITNKGEFNFSTIDKFFDAIPADMPVYGHTFIWHTQQRAAYLNALIAPEIIIEPDPSSNIENIIDNYDFENGTINPWGGWGNSSTRNVSAQGEGYESNYAMVLTNPSDANTWDAQAAYTLPYTLEVGVTYAYSAMVKADVVNPDFTFQIQNPTTYGGEGYRSFTTVMGTWILCEGEFTCEKEDMSRLCINFGKVAGTYYIDNFQFGKKKEDPDAGRTNLLANGNFNSNIDSWAKWNGPDGCNTYNETEGNSGAGCLQVVNPDDNNGGEWKVQIHADLAQVIPSGTTFYVSYYIKTAEGVGSARMSTSGKAHYQGAQTVTPSWTRAEWTVIAGGDIEGVNFDLGLKAGTYLIDDVVVSTDPFNVVTRAATTRGIVEVPKTDEQKKEIITNAMETWISGMMEHCKGRVKMWDVLNEPVTDGTPLLRGVEADIPEELDEQEFYWGQYMGKDYAVKAFQFARQYGNPDDKLFINDYNLETNAAKLDKLIEYANYIDQTNGSPIVDGIGTQMHVTAGSITRAQIDAMFKTMANTGKLVRVTELDVRLGTSTPSTEQLAQQAEVYQMIFESYKENVPAAQQSGITIWSLTDHPREHEYWLPDESPNLFDKDYGRKHAYKGVCDGIAGYDIGTDFDGDDWKNAYSDEEE